MKTTTTSVALIAAAALALSSCAVTEDEVKQSRASASKESANSPSANAGSESGNGGESSTDTPTAPPTPETLPAAKGDAATLKESALKNIKLVAPKEGESPAVSFTATPYGVEQTVVEVIEEGTGDKVSAEATVQVNYHGVNGRDGEMFDSSFKSGARPVTFPLGRVIPGFKNAIAGQKVGSKILVAIPPKDGYGPQGAPRAGIKGTDTLVFYIDILDAKQEKASE